MLPEAVPVLSWGPSLDRRPLGHPQLRGEPEDQGNPSWLRLCDLTASRRLSSRRAAPWRRLLCQRAGGAANSTRSRSHCDLVLGVKARLQQGKVLKVSQPQSGPAERRSAPFLPPPAPTALPQHWKDLYGMMTTPPRYLLCSEGRHLGGGIRAVGSHRPGGSTVTSSRKASRAARRS